MRDHQGMDRPHRSRPRNHRRPRRRATAAVAVHGRPLPRSSDPDVRDPHHYVVALTTAMPSLLFTLGLVLFLLGLLTGFAVPAVKNPRMALSSHLEAVLNGMFLVLLGLL